MPLRVRLTLWYGTALALILLTFSVVLYTITARGLPLRGVFHAAGAPDDGVLLQQDPARLARVLATKLSGAWHLHHATRHLLLDHFVLFSSVAGVHGQAGQASYAAACATSHCSSARTAGRWREAGSVTT